MSSILFISLINGESWSRSEELWHKTALYASSKGYHIACAFFNWSQKKNKVAELEKAGCQIFFLPNKGRLKRNIFEKLQYRISRSSLKKYLNDLPLNNYDVIIINVGQFELMISLHDWHLKMSNYILLFENYYEEKEFKHNEAIAIRKWLKNASVNLFISDRFKIEMENKLNMHIPNADCLINPITFNPHRTPIPFLKQNCYVFSMLAPIEINRKAQDRLVKALASPKWMQRNFILNFYGEGNDKDRIENLIARKGLSNKVFLKGHTNKVEEVLQSSHLILHISHLDGMPGIIFEALAMARPVIASNVGDIPKWVRNNVNGWIIKDTSVDEIEIVLEMAWNERNRWAHMGRKSFEIFSKEFPYSVEQRLLKQAGINLESKKKKILSEVNI